MIDAPRRRPLKVRSLALTKSIAARLSRSSITPNQISLAGIVVSIIGGVAVALAGIGQGDGRALLYLLCALMIPARGMCNILDGMVAIEGGKGTPAGELFNEVPDRFADVILFVGAGCATGGVWGAALGGLTALLAVMAAYVRALGTTMGLSADFSGPMAKPQRMLALAAACVFAAIASGFDADRDVLMISLAIICLGTGLTVARRLKRAYDQLTRKA